MTQAIVIASPDVVRRDEAISPSGIQIASSLAPSGLRSSQ